AEQGRRLVVRERAARQDHGLIMHDIADFLRQYPPFEGLDEDELERLSDTVEVEYFPAAAIITTQGAAPSDWVRVVRRGAVEVTDGGRALDLLGPGDVFGHASMLSETPASFGIRAAEDVLAYRIPADVVRPLLARPEGL